MEPLVIANKYKVVDTLFNNELQNIYIAETVESFSAEQYIINEILDGSIIYALKEVFNEDAKATMKNFLDYFYLDSNFYIVSSVPSGTTLNSYISTNSLRLSDKMYLTEHLLSELQKLDSASRLLKYHLLDLECISVAPNRSISFNLDIKFSKEGLYVTTENIIDRLGDVICCIFANTPHGSLEKDRDNLPPAIASIVKKCKEGSYSSLPLVYKDFKASLLYSTFIDNSSVDKQIMKSLQRAKRKRSFRPLKRIIAVLLIVALLVGGYFGFGSLYKNLPAIGKGSNTKPKENQIPTASFVMSKSKIYAGDKIDFVSQSADPDLDDKITSYEWAVSRNGDMYILFSREQNPSYVFETEGDYVVSLIVKDTSGISSAAYKVGFKVHSKEEIPDETSSDDSDSTIRK